MKITLMDWGERNYSPSPSEHILRTWAKSGQIVPAPEKVGKKWMVDERAVRIPLSVTTDMSTMPNRVQRILKTA